MTRRRWIADEVSGDNAALVGEHARHLVRVLRARVGQQFDIATGSSVRLAEITSINDDRVEFSLGEEIFAPATAQITLLLAVFKFDRMEWAIEKCTELGVTRMIPFIANRTDAHLASASAKRVERWQRIARQASEQSRRMTPPDIASPARLEKAITGIENFRIVLSESEREVRLRDALEAREAVGEISLAIGPEGGWTEDELRKLQSGGWISASLGGTILRAETAAIAATAIALSMLQP